MGFFKRGNRWWFSETINGEFVRRSLGPEIVTQEDAENWLEAYRVTQDELSLRGFITAYLRERKMQIAASTLRSYRASLRSFESFFGVARKINTINGRDISAWAAHRLEEGLSAESINVDLRNVKAAFNRAMIWELIDRVPRFEMVKTPKRLPRHLSEAEFAALLRHEASSDFRRLWTFMVWTGVRRGEVVGLRWEHIDFSGRPQALVTGKGDKQRFIPLLPPAVEALGPPQSQGEVFALGGKDYISHRFLRAARAAGLKAKLHDLRHTALTWMVGHNVPVKLVQEIAGHVDIKTTLGYAKTFTGGAYDTLIKAFGFD